MQKLVILLALLVTLLATPTATAAPPPRGLLAARAGFATAAAPSNHRADGPPAPPGPPFELIRYRSPAGPLAAYLRRDPGDGRRRPAVLWLHGGFGGIGLDDLAQIEPLSRGEIIVMCPSWRGENDNRGRYEMFYGEVDDALAALDHLAALPYVDPEQVYVAGHSTGGTLALLVAESSARPRAIYSLGGAPDIEAIVAAGGYDTATPPFPTTRAREAELRSPLRFVAEIKRPTYYFEGGYVQPAIEAARRMAAAGAERGAPFTAHRIEGGDHFDIVAPLLELIARKIAAGQHEISGEEAQTAFAATRPPVTVKYAPADFEMTLHNHGATVCQVIPPSADEQTACEGLDIAAIRAAAGQQKVAPVFLGFVRYEDWGAMVTVVAADDVGSADLATEKNRTEFMRGMTRTLTQSLPGVRLRGDAAGTDHTAVVVSGRAAIKTTLEVAGGNADFNRIVTYVVPSEGRTVMVQFAGGEAHLAACSKLAAESIATARIKPPLPRAEGPSEAVKTAAVGMAVLAPFVLMIAGAVAAFVIFGRRGGDKRAG